MSRTGVLVGQYSDVQGSTHGFTQAGTVFTKIDAPGAIFTQAFSVNSLGSVVGIYIDANGLTHGFLDVGGFFTPLDVPGSAATQAYSINDSGQIVGAFSDNLGRHGFTYDGTFHAIDVGTQHSTVATSINNSGQIVGYFNESGGITSSFMAVNGHITPIRTGQDATEALGISDAGVIVGILGTQTKFASFVYQHGQFSQIRPQVPRSVLTQAECVASSGQIVGWFYSAQAPAQGFIAVPTGGR
jgi:uncharacterized membrane protein